MNLNTISKVSGEVVLHFWDLLKIHSFTEGYGKWKLNRSLKATKWCKETMKVCYKEHMKRIVASTGNRTGYFLAQLAPVE